MIEMLLAWAILVASTVTTFASPLATSSDVHIVEVAEKDVDSSWQIGGDDDATGRNGITGVTTQEMHNFAHFAQYAGAAYCDPVAGRPVFCKGDICPAGTNANATVYSVFHGINTDILGFIAIDSSAHEITLSVRGTDSLANWLTDVIWARQPTAMCTGCWAHLGFLFAFSEVAPAVDAALASATRLFPGYRLAVTGHSLGAAVATLLGLHLREQGYDLDLYTYGSPRVGNEALVAHIARQPGREYRVTHNADVVTRLPPIDREFRHTSPEYWLTPGPETRTAYRAGDVQVCKGTANVDCAAGAPWWVVDVASHLYYLVAITQCGGAEPRLAVGKLVGESGLAMEEEDNDGQSVATVLTVGEPVNATTTTNVTVAGLKPTVADTLAMYAKLDQEYASALAASDVETKVVF